MRSGAFRVVTSRAVALDESSRVPCRVSGLHTVTRITSRNARIHTLSLYQPAHGGPVEVLGMKMNMPTAMNMSTAMNPPLAEMEDTELRILSDNELDGVNGGLSWYTKALLIAIGIGLSLA